MGILGWLIMGLVAGAIAKALHRGNEPGAFLLLPIYSALTGDRQTGHPAR